MKTIIGVLAASAAVVLGSALGARAQCVVPPLAAVGPVDPANGFPFYYIDSEGTALGPCLDFECDPALGLPDPALPVSFPGNFPDEFFYHRVIAQVSAPALAKATLVLAVEGAFANGLPAAGDQMVFARTRVTIVGGAANGTYTVTHPYGVITGITTDALGEGRFNDDIGIVPQVFTAALNGNIGPFLHFATGPVPPFPGNIGTSLAPQTVTGSPCGTNFFRVEGTGLPAGGVTTTLFDTIIGKLAAECGDGIVSADEACDDGNTVAGDCCSPDCTLEPAGSPCDDGNLCTVNSTCDAAGVCQVTAFASGACEDGNPFTICDRCSLGVCVAGPEPICPPIEPACTPTTCAAEGKNCGSIPDGCGGTLTCGTCTTPETCGGGGVANVCGAPAPAATAVLTVIATGRGGERVSSAPAGINVPTGSTASATFPVGTSITLSATNRRDVIWSGVCSSGGQKVKTCTFTLNANATETANVQ